MFLGELVELSDELQLSEGADLRSVVHECKDTLPEGDRVGLGLAELLRVHLSNKVTPTHLARPQFLYLVVDLGEDERFGRNRRFGDLRSKM